MWIREMKERMEEKKEKEKVEDFEVAEDGRITKINNRDSQQKVYIIYGAEAEICNLGAMDKMINFGLLYATAEARDRAMFKLEIETKLKNIAERLNNGIKIDWEDKKQEKYYIYYDYDDKKLEWFVKCYRKDQGVVYCLDKNFLDVAKKEIEEEQLIKYFKESYYY